MPEEPIGVADLYRKLDAFAGKTDDQFRALLARFEEFLRTSSVNDAKFELRLTEVEKKLSVEDVDKTLSKRHRAQMFWSIVGSFIVGGLGIVVNFLH